MSLRFVSAFVVVVAACASTPPPPPSAPPAPSLTAAQLAEQMAAPLRQGPVKEQEYLKGLEAAVAAEPRNEAWAAQREAALRKYPAATPEVPGGVLKLAECHSTKCVLRFDVSPEPKAALAQQAAINTWVSVSQSCAYTLTAAPDPGKAAGSIRVFLDCAGR